MFGFFLQIGFPEATLSISVVLFGEDFLRRLSCNNDLWLLILSTEFFLGGEYSYPFVVISDDCLTQVWPLQDLSGVNATLFRNILNLLINIPNTFSVTYFFLGRR